jgi:protein involved in temperature-dependent protein secretion
MNGDQLFINLVYRLRSFPEAAVLWALLREQADDQEYITTAFRITDKVSQSIEAKTAQRTFQRLETKGLIEVRTHKNTATHVKVNREAVFALLETKLFPMFLPGQGKEHDLPFLAAFNARQENDNTNAAVKTASTTDGNVKEEAQDKTKDSNEEPMRSMLNPSSISVNH